MIIWISGAYGVGKSALAEALAEKIEDALVFDAEKVGNAVRRNYSNCSKSKIMRLLWNTEL